MDRLNIKASGSKSLPVRFDSHEPIQEYLQFLHYLKDGVQLYDPVEFSNDIGSLTETYLDHEPIAVQQ